MTQQRLTQCPHCKASFKVSEEQLNAANGRVRCGACMNIFDAIAYSLSSADEHRTPTEEEKIPVDLEDDILDDDDSLFADNPEEDQQEEGYSGSKQMSDELSTSFLELDEGNNDDPYATSFKKLEDDFISQDAVDESWTKDILDDLDSQPAHNNGKKKEPTISTTDLEEELFSNSVQASSDSDGQDTLQTKQDKSYEKIEFQYQQDREPRRHWFITFLFVLANIALLAVLLAQASWYHYEKLARYPQVANIYEQACAKIGCKLPKLEDINQIKSQNLVVRSHPTARKSLIIDTIIVNKASFEQRFPNIALYFSDINKNTIAQRLLSPTEYLSGDLLNWDKMPSDQPIHISLEILDPGKEAVNYHLEFYPQAEN